MEQFIVRSQLKCVSDLPEAVWPTEYIRSSVCISICSLKSMKVLAHCPEFMDILRVQELDRLFCLQSAGPVQHVQCASMSMNEDLKNKNHRYGSTLLIILTYIKQVLDWGYELRWFVVSSGPSSMCRRFGPTLFWNRMYCTFPHVYQCLFHSLRCKTSSRTNCTTNWVLQSQLRKQCIWAKLSGHCLFYSQRERGKSNPKPPTLHRLFLPLNS